MTGEFRAFRRRRLSREAGEEMARRALETPLAEREEKACELHLDDPETVAVILETLRERCEASPQLVFAEAVFLHEYLKGLSPVYPIDPMFLDEREQFLGEAARLVAGACRDLSRRDEARRWLDFSEGWFRLTTEPGLNLCQVAYERLALRTEEREFEAVLELLAQLTFSFEKLEGSEGALKCLALRAVILKETDQLGEATEVFREVCQRAQALGNEKLLGSAFVNLLQIHAFLGETEKAFDIASEATPLLRKFNNRIDLAKLQLGLGYLLRGQHKASQAIDAYRIAQKEFAELGMHADVAANQLVVADLLLELGQEAQAEWEIRAALPVIDEYKLVPEGFVALSLLQESVRRRKIDRKALRDLHGYFEELES